MPDREKVMSWLEGLAEPDWRECYSDSEVQETARQALDLIDELLKEQEAVDPRPAIFDIYRSAKLYHCSICSELIVENQKYCHGCGQAVKWE